MYKLISLFLLISCSTVFAESQSTISSDQQAYEAMSKIIAEYGVDLFGEERVKFILQTKGLIMDECQTRTIDAFYDSKTKTISIERQFNYDACIKYFEKQSNIVLDAEIISESLRLGSIIITCGNPVDRAGVDSGIIFSYVYEISEDQIITTSVVTKQSCKDYNL